MKSKVWWEQTPGPLNIIRQIIEGLIGGKSIWLEMVECAWKSEFYCIIKEELINEAPFSNIEFINAADIYNEEQVRECILQLDTRDRPQYYKSQSFDKYLKKYDICKDSVLWIYNIQDSVCSYWKVISENLAREEACIQMCCEFSVYQIGYKNIVQINAKDYISEFDILHFVMNYILQFNLPAEYRIYVSRLITEVVHCNLDLCEEYCNHLQELSNNTYGYLSEYNEPEYVQSAIWRAQIKSIYPEVEVRRERLIQQLKKSIKGCLPFTDNFGMTYYLPEELELRHIMYFEKNNQITLSRNQMSELELLHSIRNDLSHLSIIDEHRVNQFFMK